MGLYQLKEFLDFDDVAEYLTDKGVYEFDVSQEYDYRKLKNFIKELYQGDKITPVFYCDTSLSKIHGIYGIEKEVEPPTMVGFRYFICNYDMMKAFFNDCPIHTNFCVGDAKKFYRLYQDNSPYYIYIADGNKNDFEAEILFPKCELDNLFLQHQKDNLQQQINTIDSQLDGKELPTRTANNASKIILAMAELLEWDLSKPFADETNGKIREILEKQGNVLSKDTVGQWLKQAYDIGK